MNHPTDRRRKLGRTDLDVCRIGIGGGNSLSDVDLDYAVSRGVNYLFTSSDLHAVTYSQSWPAFRRFGSSSIRDNLVIVGCSYVCDPEKLMGVMMDQLLAWGLDYVDVFQWGWLTQVAEATHLLETTKGQLDSGFARMYIERHATVARQVGDELRSRGYARYLGVSTHDRSIARSLIDDHNLDVVMLRYNIAHRGVEKDVFPYLKADARPGVVAFNALHDASGLLTHRPASLPEGKYVPTIADLYRYCLDRDEVDVVLSGPATREQIDVALTALDLPPHEEKRRDYFQKYGDLHVGRARLAHA